MSDSVLRRVRLTVGLVTALGVSQGSAASVGTVQAAEANAADTRQVCSAEDTWLEIHVGGTNRGTVLTRLVGPEVWLDPRALRPDEGAYFDAELSCGHQQYVRLLHRLSPRVDLQQLTMSVQPAPETLAGHSLTVKEPVQEPATSQPLFFLDYAAAVSGDFSTSPAMKLGLRAHYLDGPVFAATGIVADTTSGRVRWLPSAQLGLNLSPTSSVQLVYNATDVWGITAYALSGPSAVLFTGARFQRSTTPVQVWPTLTLTLPFQSHLRVRIDGLVLAEYDVAAGPLTLHDLPLHNQKGQIEVEIRDETGTRTILQAYSFPGLPPGSSDLSLDAGALNAAPYLGVQGRWTASPQVDVEGRVRVVGMAVQAQVRAVAAPDDSRAFSVGLVYDSQQQQPLNLVGRLKVIASPLTAAAFATVPINDVTQTQVGLSLSYRTRTYAVRGEASAGAAAGLAFTLGGDFPVSSTLTMRPTLTLRRDALRAGLALEYRPDKTLTVRSTVSGGRTLTGAVAAQYRLNAATEIGLAADASQATVDLHHADRVRVDASLSTRGSFSLAAQGSAFVSPGQTQLNQGGADGAFVTLETALPGLQVFANGQPKGRTDSSGRLIFSVVPGRAVMVRINADSLPFDVTLKSDTTRIDLPGPGSYQLDWRSNFVHSRFVTFHWADGTLATYAQLRFENGEIAYTDGLGTGFLAVSGQDRRATLTSGDGARVCGVTVAAHTTLVACAP